MTVLDVIPEGPSEGPVATRLVERVRGLERPVAAGVTGPAAFLVDYRDSLAGRLPYALALIGLATFVLLFLMTGSVVVPVKAIVMNVLSLGRASAPWSGCSRRATCRGCSASTRRAWSTSASRC
jgi:putative drug exporter of the RND superfamily